MPCSTARRLTNQRNARKSIGPNTEAGKLVVRMNSPAMRGEHGFMSPYLTEAVAKRNSDAD